jgi:hypothetical protein
MGGFAVPNPRQLPILQALFREELNPMTAFLLTYFRGLVGDSILSDHANAHSFGSRGWRGIGTSCEAWNKLVDQPWRIMSIGLRQWAHGF